MALEPPRTGAASLDNPTRMTRRHADFLFPSPPWLPVEARSGAFRGAASGSLAGILRYSTDPLISRDVVGDPASCVFDSGLGRASGRLAKIFGWYDNE